MAGNFGQDVSSLLPYFVTFLFSFAWPASGALNEELLKTSYDELEITRTEGACLSSHNCLP